MPGRSALTVTPCTAAIVPIALSVAGHCSLCRHHGRDRLRRRLKRRALRDGGLNLPELHEAKAGDDRNHDSERDNHSLDHMLPICADDESLRGMRCRPARMTDE